MNFDSSTIAEIMGLALVFVGLFKLDAINKSLGAFSEFAKSASEEIKSLRTQGHKHANQIQELRSRVDIREYYERKSKKD